MIKGFSYIYRFPTHYTKHLSSRFPFKNYTLTFLCRKQAYLYGILEDVKLRYSEMTTSLKKIYQLSKLKSQFVWLLTGNLSTQFCKFLLYYSTAWIFVIKLVCDFGKRFLNSPLLCLCWRINHFLTNSGGFHKVIGQNQTSNGSFE